MYFIIGSEGFLGKKIQNILPNNKTINISSKKRKNCIKTNLFLTNKKKNEKWIKKIKKNDTVILLSNPGSLNYSEQFPKRLLQFEKNLDKKFFSKVNKNIKIIFFSSDMIYGDKKNTCTDQTNTKPINNYGRSKKRIENKIKKYFKKYLILRFSKIFSIYSADNTIYYDMVNQIKKKKYIKLFNNQYVHYLDSRDFILGFKKIIKKLNQLNGTFNFPGKNFTTRYKFAKKICKKHKLNNKYIIPIKVEDKKIKIPRKIKMRTNLFSKINFFPKY